MLDLASGGGGGFFSGASLLQSHLDLHLDGFALEVALSLRGCLGDGDSVLELLDAGVFLVAFGFEVGVACDDVVDDG